jgi:uncharacterized protein with HEPN domain
MRRDPQTIVQDAIRAAEDIVALLGDMTESQFVEDLRTQRAIERSSDRSRLSGKPSQGSRATFRK